MPSLDDLVANVNDLIPLPQAYVRISQLIHDPDSSLREIAEIITNDISLTGRILRVANSAYMGLITKVDSIAQAVPILGLRQIHDLALATTAVETLSNIASADFDLHAYWRRSLYCAIAARLLGKRCGLSRNDRLFVTGLLHDVGHLLLAYKEPALYTELRTTAIERRVPMYQVEREVLGFDYAAVSGALLNKWQLPSQIIDPIRAHNRDLANVKPEKQPDTAIVHLAAAISRSAQWHSDEDEPAPQFDPLAVHLTGLDDTMVVEIMNETDVALIEAITLLMPKSIRKTACK